MSSARHGAIVRWLAVVAWAVVISIFSTEWFTGERTAAVILPLLALLFPSLSPAELARLHEHIRKAAHFTEYLVLSILIYRALTGSHRWSVRAAVTAVLLAAVYSGGDELHQWFVPGRTAAATDCLIDVSGAAAGQGLLAAWARARA